MTNTQKKLLNIYALLWVGVVLMAVPYDILVVIGLSCFLVGFVSCYIYRWRNRRDEMFRHYTTSAIRTVWWSQLIFIAGIILFGSIIFLNGDLSMINAMYETANKGILMTESDLIEMQAKFIHQNWQIIRVAFLIAFLPFYGFLFYRFGRDVRRIVRG